MCTISIILGAFFLICCESSWVFGGNTLMAGYGETDPTEYYLLYTYTLK